MPTHREELIDVVTRFAHFYRVELDKHDLEIYITALHRFTAPEVTAAFNAHIMDDDQGGFMPKPSHLIAHITEVRKANAANAPRLESYSHAKDPCARAGPRVTWDQAKAIMEEAGYKPGVEPQAKPVQITEERRKAALEGGPRPETKATVRDLVASAAEAIRDRAS